MSKGEELFHKIAAEIPEAKESKMFGSLCLKAPNGKAGVMFWKEYMIFKLNAADLAKALTLKDAKIFEPMEGRPMNGWLQLSAQHINKWNDLAQKAMAYVKEIEVAPKKKAKK